MTKIAINGLGRLGRNLLRIALDRADVQVIGLHEIASGHMSAHLLEFDSIHKSHIKNVNFCKRESSASFGADSKSGVIRLENSNKKLELPLFIDLEREGVARAFEELGAEVVIEASGKFLETSAMSAYKNVKVIISAPATDDTPTFVYGVNEQSYSGERVISNASCTSHALACIAKVLDETFGIETGVLTTIHSYTYDQNLLDNAHRSDFRRARGAASNIIPTSTGAAKSIYKVLPKLKGKLHGHSVRVPINDVSIIDLSVKLGKHVSTQSINEALIHASKTSLRSILGIDNRMLVSSDFIDSPYSAVVAQDLTFSLEGGMSKIIAWYDNESGYAHRLLDMAVFINKYARECL